MALTGAWEGRDQREEPSTAPAAPPIEAVGFFGTTLSKQIKGHTNRLLFSDTPRRAFIFSAVLIVDFHGLLTSRR